MSYPEFDYIVRKAKSVLINPQVATYLGIGITTTMLAYYTMFETGKSDSESKEEPPAEEPEKEEVEEEPEKEEEPTEEEPIEEEPPISGGKKKKTRYYKKKEKKNKSKQKRSK
jgi:hypothetical protein